jgi:hypothetical protein
MAEGQHDQEGRHRLADDDDEQGREHRQRRATRIIGSNSMPTETKNSTAKASRSGSDSSAARWLSSDSLRIMPAKKAPSAKDTPNSTAGPGDAERDGQHRQAEQFARAGVRDIVQQPGNDAAPDDQHEADEDPTLASVMRDQPSQARARRRCVTKSTIGSCSGAFEPS